MGVTGLMGAMAGWLLPQPAPEIAASLRASRVHRTATDPLVGTDCWERQVLEHCDGKPVPQILEALNLEQIRAGAAAVDIGFWKGLFDQGVLITLGELARGGYIRLHLKRGGFFDGTCSGERRSGDTSGPCIDG